MAPHRRVRKDQRVVTASFFTCRRLAGALLIAALLLLPDAIYASGQPQLSVRSAVPSARDLMRISPTGNYLAARHAKTQRDAAAAAAYYRAALRADPRNADLLENAFLATLAEGDMEEAFRLAERIIQIDRSDIFARLVLGLRALKQKQYALARVHLSVANRGMLTDLMATLLIGWAHFGANEPRAGVEAIDKLTGPDWYALLKHYHAGLILDAANVKKEAGKRFEQAYQLTPNSLRYVEAYGSWLSRNVGRQEALKLFKTFDSAMPRHPVILQAMKRLNLQESDRAAADVIGLRLGQSGEAVKRLQLALGLKPDGNFGPGTERALKNFQQKHGLRPDGVVNESTWMKLGGGKIDGGKGEGLPPLVATAQEGAAEVLYNIVMLLNSRRDDELYSVIYLQLALYLMPNHVLALYTLAEIYNEQLKKYDLAIKFYERVPPDSPLRRNAEISIATLLDTLNRPDEARNRLEKLIAERPDDLEAVMALGNILRNRKQHAECIEVYNRGIATIAEPGPSHWLVYFHRAICYERSKQWEKAEADLKMALKLFPDHPHVLNYLGYSWIDQGVNLEEGMRMIRRAVEQRPEDGYIVDSLGWAYYRMGNYEEAIKHLERAVELRPTDPTINDHLGDVYWRVGRKREAIFQWTHARDLNPEPEELERILQKLKSGLPDEPAAADAGKPKKPGNGG
jgi:tetratricopeptide (TPR) repeat protein